MNEVPNSATSILKVAKAAKIGGVLTTVFDAGTNLIDAYIYAQEGNTKEAWESGTKAAVGVAVTIGSSIASAAATGAAAGAWGGPVGLVVGVVVIIAIVWGLVSGLDWW